MRFNETRNNNRNRVPITLAVSLLIHAIALIVFSTFIDLSSNENEQNEVRNNRPLRVRVVSGKKVEKKKKKIKQFEKLQIVSAPKPEKEITPDKAKFADRYASKVEKETVKKGQKGSPVLANRKSNEEKTTLPKMTKGSKDKENKVKEQKRVEASQKTEKGKAPQIKKEGVILEKENGETGGTQKLDTQSLFPQLSDATLLNPNGVGGTNDYLKNVEEDSKTLLNRKQTRYWAFFDRVKTQIVKEWNPKNEYKERDPFGDIYGVKDRYSVINVTLNSDGSVRRLYIDKKSGADFLDDEALRAVKQASPYNNPPEGLKDENGHIYFKFGFYLEVGTGRMQLFRTKR